MYALSGDFNAIINHYQHQFLTSEYSNRLDFSLKRLILPVITDYSVSISILVFIYSNKNKAAQMAALSRISLAVKYEFLMIY